VPFLRGPVCQASRFDEESDQLALYIERNLKDVIPSRFIVASADYQRSVGINMRGLAECEPFVFCTVNDFAQRLLSIWEAMQYIDPDVLSWIPDALSQFEDLKLPDEVKRFSFDPVAISEMYQNPDGLAALKFDSILDARIMKHFDVLHDYQFVPIWGELDTKTVYQRSKFVEALSSSENLAEALLALPEDILDQDPILFHNSLKQEVAVLTCDRKLAQAILRVARQKHHGAFVDAAGDIVEIIESGRNVFEVFRRRGLSLQELRERYFLDEPNWAGYHGELDGEPLVPGSLLNKCVERYRWGKVPMFTWPVSEVHNERIRLFVEHCTPHLRQR
jgi:hypothetical protein